MRTDKGVVEERSVVERKLAVILALDIVGYSALMERDEAGTFERLRAIRKEFWEPTAGKYRGRIFKLMGDGVLIEFGSVVDAIECAIAIQADLAERGAKAPEDQRMLARIGINLGEVIVEGEDRYGEGVNVAARLQTLAEPGGICVSGKVAKEAEKKLNFAFESMGKRRVKNIAEPIPVFSVKVGGAAKASRPPLAKPPASRAGGRIWKAGLVAAALLAAGGGGIWLRRPEAARVSGPPTLAVLPLANMSGDPALQYYADGTTENLIAVLARSPQIKVVARTSTDAYKGKAVDIRQIGKELNARYVLEGSVQKSADKMRIVAQLIDAKTGEHVWADRFDHAGADPLALQDEVSEKIVKTLAGDQGVIKKKEYEREWGKDSLRMDEWDYYLRGHEAYVQGLMRGSREENDKAGQIWSEGLKKFPDSALLKAKMGWFHYQRWVAGWGPDSKQDGQEMIRIANEVSALQGATPLALAHARWQRAVGFGEVQGDYEQAAREMEAVIKLLPGEIQPKQDRARYIAASGKPDEALASLNWLGDESKGDAFFADGFCVRAFAYFIKKDYTRSVASLQGTTDLPPYCLAFQAAAYYMDGQGDKAKETAKKLLSLSPGYSVETFLRTFPLPDKEVQGRLAEALRQAGLSEG